MNKKKTAKSINQLVSIQLNKYSSAGLDYICSTTELDHAGAVRFSLTLAGTLLLHPNICSNAGMLQAAIDMALGDGKGIVIEDSKKSASC